MKQKLASTTVTEMAEKNRKKPSAMVSMEKVQATREAQRAEVQAEREAAMKQKFQRIRARREVQQYHQMKNRKGQPVMSGKVSALMSKIQNSK
ncbi:rRNA processing protein, putative [Bodo saltans]|uniref:rRNA processing protein, putative n=1 Tax=Bodo saltans TaxID=75058 RepID=A0A0S4J6D9_BODSA|nr:rRNA processing protein, putative [Bodo saltans]|eukprot:CUG86030.1 rRNA processing protein, putative [Bodo saltans]